MIIPFISEKALSLYAEKEAVVCHEHRNTYQQFADRTYRFANLLHTMGVKKSDCIAILHQNSHEFLETYFAAAHLGVTLNPLNLSAFSSGVGVYLKGFWCHHSYCRQAFSRIRRKTVGTSH